MRRVVLSFLSLVLLLALSAEAAPIQKFKPAQVGGIPDSYIVVLEDGAAGKATGRKADPKILAALAEGLVRRHGGRVHRTWDRLTGGFLAELTEPAARALARNPNVKHILQNRYLDVDLSAVPVCGEPTTPPVPFTSFNSSQTSQPITCADPVNNCSDNWGLSRIDQPSLPLDTTYQFNGKTGSGVHVYVIDTGITAGHSEFTGRIGEGVNFTGSFTGGTDQDTVDCYGNGHGTHVSAILGGKTFGVAKGVTIHPVKAIGACPRARTTVAWMLDATEWVSNHVAANNWPAVVNFSSNIRVGNPQAVGSELPPYTQTDLDLINAAFASLAAQVPVVNSAGNFDTDACLYTPTSVPGVIVASGTTIGDVRWTHSAGSAANYGACVDLFAPAADILSASNSTAGSLACRLAGTSMAAPHTAGVIALYLQDNPNASVSEVTTALLQNAVSGKVSDLGAGSPNLLLQMIGPAAPPCVTNDSRSTPANTCFNILASEMQANDCSAAEFLNAGDPEQGTLTIAGIGPEDIVYRYCPPTGFTGTDHFTYRVQGAGGAQAEATVTVTVTGTAVVAHPDALMARLNTPLRFKASDLTANDTPGAVFVRVENPVQGTISIAGIGPEDVLYDYIPPTGYIGQDTFEYKISFNGNQPYTTGVVTVTIDDWPPQPSFMVSCTGLACSFNASASTDDGGITSYAWSFGDGTTGTGASVSHTYAVGSSYQVTLTLTDTRPQTASLSKIATVDALPVPSFTFACTALTCNFNASASTDDDGIATYAWDFGDGTTGSGVTTSRTYATSGQRTVKLKVTDTFGQMVEISKPVKIDLPPTACFTATRNGLTYTFNASCSTDDFGITGYSWNFGDGTTGSGSSVTRTYATSGPRTVTLTVTDTASQTGATSQTVNPDAKPVANFTWSCTLRSCTFNGTSSTDNAPIVSYAWTFGDGATGSGATTSRNYAAGGTYNVTLTVTDSVGQTHSKTQAIALNRPPVAVNDSASTPPNTAIDLNVIANDSDADGTALTVTWWSQGAHGTVSKNANGTMRYVPNAGWLGSDTFQYRVSDGQEESNTATVTVSTNNPPDARDDGWSTYQNGPINIPYTHMLGNDFDPNGDTLAVSSVNTAGLTGTLDCSSGTYCRYTPPSWFIGTTTFTYIASDGKGGTDSATVKIKVGVTNNLPAPQTDILEVAYGTPLAFTAAGLLANDTDADGDVLSVTQVVTAFYTRFGSVSCTTPIYNCTYTPPAGFTGVDVVTYRASDGVSFTDAQVRFVVRPPSPTVLDAKEDQIFSTTVKTYISYSLMTSNDYDPEGGYLTVVSVDTTGLVGTLDCVTYHPMGCEYTRGTSNPTRFKYTVQDPQGNQATATVTLKPGNWSYNLAPVVANDTMTATRNTAKSFTVFDVLRNDYDPDNDQLNLTFNYFSTSGRVVCTTPAYLCTYTPNANFTGTDTLTYTVNDGTNSATGTVTVTVNP